MTKQIFRRKYLEIRDKNPKKTLINSGIYTNFIRSEIYKNCSELLIYVSIGSEPDTRRIINSALSDGKKVYVPKCLDNQGSMTFKRIFSLSDLTPGFFNIPEPAPSSPSLYIEKTQLDSKSSYHSCFSKNFRRICVVPGVVFDRSGHRIGYGKGYYDRYLREKSIFTVGFCFSESVVDSVPHDATDCTVNAICTEKELFILTD